MKLTYLKKTFVVAGCVAMALAFAACGKSNTDVTPTPTPTNAPTTAATPTPTKAPTATPTQAPVGNVQNITANVDSALISKITTSGLDSVLTAEDKADTKEVNIAFNVKTLTDSAAELKATAAGTSSTVKEALYKAAGAKASDTINYLQFDVVKTVKTYTDATHATLSKTTTENVTASNGLVTVTVDLKEALPSSGVSVVRYYDNGDGTSSTVKLSNVAGAGEYYTINGNQLVLTVNRFSTYAVVVDSAAAGNGDVPQTGYGDSDLFFVALVMISFLGMAGLVISRKTKRA